MSNQMQPLRFVLYLVDGPPEIAAEQWSFSDVKYMELETLELGKSNANQMTMAAKNLASAKAAVVKSGELRQPREMSMGSRECQRPQLLA